MKEIEKQIRLQCTNLGGNNNKWWTGTLFKDGSTLVEYGRVGDTCVRPFTNKSWSEVEKTARKKQSLSNAPESRYTEIKMNEIQVVYTNNNVVSTASKRVQKIFDNANESLSKTSTIDVSNLSLFQLEKGKKALKTFSILPTVENLQIFFNLIPTILPRKIDINQVKSNILEKLQDEEDRIDQLIAAVDTNKVQKDGGDLFAQLGSNLVENLDIQRFQDWINKTSVHGYKYTVKEVWDVDVLQEHGRDKVFAEVGNVRELFHATTRPNVRHILRTGLICPSYASNGRMYGNGIYFADTCSKSLNYTESNGENYLFVGECALGITYDTRCTQRWNDVPHGYNSLFAEAGEMKGAYGGSLRFNEYVIYKQFQQRLKHLLVIEKQ